MCKKKDPKNFWNGWDYRKGLNYRYYIGKDIKAGDFAELIDIAEYAKMADMVE